VDAYFERGLNPWDFAAGAVLVTEAGGRVTDLEGRPTSGGMVVAAPVELHGPLLELLRSAGAEVA
jgi:myo-inositol-1(or 4)-monophosphatase